MLMFYGKYKTDKSFRAMDMKRGTYAKYIKYATQYDDKVESLLINELERLNNENPDWKIKLVKKG